LALLVFAFGSVVAALLPLAMGMIAILGTFAELSVLGSVTSVAIYAINLTTALGLALAIDYALLMVSRYREELGRGQEPARAVVRSVQTAGRTIVFSGATVMAALAVLLIFRCISCARSPMPGSAWCSSRWPRWWCCPHCWP